MGAHHEHAGAGEAPFSLEVIRHLEASALLRVLLLSAGELLRRGFNTASTWQVRARQRRDLQLLNDHLLKDIGITREQARLESDKPFWRV